MAARSLFLKNRLLFGAALRADIVSIFQLRRKGFSGRRVADLIGAHPSSVSRVLADLRACRFIAGDGTLVGRHPSYPGLFISAISIRDVPQILDAATASAELKRAMLPEIDAAIDRMGSALAATVR